ncbi:hypothetical protein ABWH88_09965 [Marinobacter adhaerens]|nr:hypothetical protein [Marinobacter adhaerens]
MLTEHNLDESRNPVFWSSGSDYWSKPMNMFLGLIGFGGFVVTLTLLGLAGYWKADQLEAWAKKHFSKGKDSHG